MQLNIFLHELIKEEKGMTYISSLLPVTRENLEMTRNLLKQEIKVENDNIPLTMSVVNNQWCYRFEGKLNGFTS